MEVNLIKVGIIGCGLIGQKRAKLLKGAELVACSDQDRSKANLLAQSISNCAVETNWQDLIARSDIQAVIIATPHAALAEISLAAVKAGKHILVEKPAARNVNELKPVYEAAQKSGVLVRIGFNHRYHRAFRKAKILVEEGALGDLMFIRARYGHGGRIGYDREWRADPVLSGGGELLDQGVHLIDLARWFLGDFTEIDGYADTYFWDMLVDDNGFMMLKTAQNQVAFLHAICTEWKNIFSFELYGKLGKLEINGLGGSYGIETLRFYKMLPQMGPPETTIWEYPMADDSWEVELAEFWEDIHLARQPASGLEDALAALEIVETIYRKSGL